MKLHWNGNPENCGKLLKSSFSLENDDATIMLLRNVAKSVTLLLPNTGESRAKHLDNSFFTFFDNLPEFFHQTTRGVNTEQLESVTMCRESMRAVNNSSALINEYNTKMSVVIPCWADRSCYCSGIYYIIITNILFYIALYYIILQQNLLEIKPLNSDFSLKTNTSYWTLLLNYL